MIQSTSKGMPVRFVLAIAMLGTTWACVPDDAYKKLLERERTSGIRHDSLFLGYSLGMAKDSFYSHSWDLNRQGLVMQGPQNQTVQYSLPDALPYPARMNFYPDFHEDQVFRMRITFAYEGWAPWTQRLSSDSLKLDVVSLLESWYGAGFFPHGSVSRGLESETPMVKVDGNRHIEVATATDMEVIVVITDMVAARTRELAGD